MIACSFDYGVLYLIALCYEEHGKPLITSSNDQSLNDPDSGHIIAYLVSIKSKY